MNFIEALTKELHQWEDDTLWIHYQNTQEMVTQAAAATLPDPLPQITFRREIDPDGMRVVTILEIEGEYTATFDANDIATLRALLLSWNESDPIQLGEALSMPTRLGDGRVVSVVVPELLEG